MFCYITGFYLHIDASDKGRNDAATIISPSFVGASRITFYYHSYGLNTGSLFIHEQNHEGLHNEIFRQNSMNGKLYAKYHNILTKYICRKEQVHICLAFIKKLSNPGTTFCALIVLMV